MTAYEVLRLFASQLERRILSGKFRTKVVLLPSAIHEKGLVITIAPRKVLRQSQPRQGSCEARYLNLRVAVQGAAESLTGLEQALDAIQALDDYLRARQPSLHLENAEGFPIANTSITQTVSEQDSFMDSPDAQTVVEVSDERFVQITWLGTP
jgi:hypothetical protein